MLMGRFCCFFLPLGGDETVEKLIVMSDGCTTL